MNAPFWGELVGTAILILLGCGVCAGVSLQKSFSYRAGWLVTAFGWGLSVAIAVYAVQQVSGAHLNPAVTIGLAVIGAFPWHMVPTYIAAQLLGAMIGASVMYVHYFSHFKQTEDDAAKLSVFATRPAISHSLCNIINETLATFLFIFGNFFFWDDAFPSFIKPVVVGGLLVTVALTLGGTTGCALNPARDLGPRLVYCLFKVGRKGSANWAYAWIPIVGPLLGGCLATLVYEGVFAGRWHCSLVWVGGVAFILFLGIFWMNRQPCFEKDEVHSTQG